MRISCDKADPHYMEIAYACTVLLDGKSVHDCVTADTDIGEIICYATSKSGKLIISDDDSGEIKKEARHGKVEIKLPIGWDVGEMK